MTLSEYNTPENDEVADIAKKLFNDYLLSHDVYVKRSDLYIKMNNKKVCQFVLEDKFNIGILHELFTNEKANEDENWSYYDKLFKIVEDIYLSKVKKMNSIFSSELDEDELDFYMNDVYMILDEEAPPIVDRLSFYYYTDDFVKFMLLSKDKFFVGS